jgi:hypothetical protein
MAFEIEIRTSDAISKLRDSFNQNAGKDGKNNWPSAFGKPQTPNGKKDGVLKRLGSLKINPT